MSHANAALTPRHRLKVAQLVVDHGWPISEVAARFQVSWPTVKRWADRYRAGQSMQDRSSRPHRSPNKTSPTTAKRCIQLRLRLREGPVQLAYRIGVAPSTVHRILVDVHLNRLSHVDRATGEPVRRYEHDHPGAMLHVDVKKLGNIPDGGGWRYVGRRQGEKNRAATPDKPKNKHYDPLMGKAYVHTVIDDHSRLAYAEIHDDEKGTTAAGVLERAIAFYATLGVKVERVISDNAFAYRHSAAFRSVIDAHGITQKFIRPHCPWTNGKVERLNRTLATEWAYARAYASNTERAEALPAWLDYYNLDRAHLGIGGKTPIDRINNGRGQYN